MFKSELKKSIERLKDVTLRELAPLLGMLAVCTTIAVFWNVSDSLFLKMVGYVTFLSLFWFQLYEKVKDFIVETYLMERRSRYGYIRSIETNFVYSLFLILLADIDCLYTPCFTVEEYRDRDFVILETD